MATTEFQSATNLLNRVLDKIKLESRALETAKLAVIISVVFAVLTLVGIAAAFKTSAKVNYEFPRMQDEIDQTRIRNDLYSMYMQELYVELKNQGFDPPPLPEEE